MATPYFKFKQFTVWHDKCAMKVGTDGVLLGAMAPLDSKTRILDVGTGTGLIALMLAQRAQNEMVRVTALELDKEACLQAQENINESPWAHLIEVVESDYSLFQAEELYDLIVSNPPYFVDSLKSPTTNRSQARHTDTLSFEELIRKSWKLLAPKGVFAVIIPTDVELDFCDKCQSVGLYLSKRVAIQTKPDVQPKRVVLMFVMQEGLVEQETLLIELERHVFSEEYINLTRDFYLKM